jgi:hypothetical protein
MYADQCHYSGHVGRSLPFIKVPYHNIQFSAYAFGFTEPLVRIAVASTLAQNPPRNNHYPSLRNTDASSGYSFPDFWLTPP